MGEFKLRPPVPIEEALTRVGELLMFDGESVSIVVLGGAALNLLGFVARPTGDVDVLAFAEGSRLVEPPEPLPTALVRAVRAVASRLALPDDWLNTTVALQWKLGLPPGLASRVEWRRYGGLVVGLVGRYDLVFFKLYAAVDDGRANGVHCRDLIALAPTPDELDAAAAWTREQDPSPGFSSALELTLRHVRNDLRY